METTEKKHIPFLFNHCSYAVKGLYIRLAKYQATETVSADAILEAFMEDTEFLDGLIKDLYEHTVEEIKTNFLFYANNGADNAGQFSLLERMQYTVLTLEWSGEDDKHKFLVKAYKTGKCRLVPDFDNIFLKNGIIDEATLSALPPK